MTTRNVTGSSKDEDGDITGLCGPWGSADKATVIKHIKNGPDDYKVNNRTKVMTYEVDGTTHIKTVPNGDSRDNLDSLPNC